VSGRAAAPRKKPAGEACLPDRVLTLALAGRPNVGKSTFFNHVTGLAQHTGNWPGKTVEIAQGEAVLDGQRVVVIDLPGAYSLLAESPEEELAREFIEARRADLVLAVVSAANLEQELAFLAELLAMPGPVMVVLTMGDVLRRRGLKVDAAALQRRLGVPVATVEGPSRSSYLEVLSRAVAYARSEGAQAESRAPSGPLARAPGLGPLERASLVGPWSREMTARALTSLGRVHAPQSSAPPASRSAGKRVRRRRGPEPAAVPGAACPVRGAGLEAADRFLIHPFWGLLALLGVLAGTFWLTFSLGAPLQAWLGESLVAPVGGWLRAAAAGLPEWVGALLADGILAGAGTVATFAPVLAVFFALVAVLEDSGYLARAAVVTDGLMHHLGLHGKSFLPLFIGFGCNVPAVLGARTIDSGPARLLTLILAPIVPCAGRLAVLTFVGAAFFGSRASLVVWGMVALALVGLALVGRALAAVVNRGKPAELVMELPLYTFPSFRGVLRLVLIRLQDFLVRAGTLIVLASTVVWALGYFPAGHLDTSYLAGIGRAVEPLGRAAGLDWRLVVAVLGSLVAKENAVAVLGVLYAGSGRDLTTALTASVSPASALSFLAVMTLFVPCVATLAALWRETAGQRHWTLVVVAVQVLLSMAAGAVVYQAARVLLGG